MYYALILHELHNTIHPLLVFLERFLLAARGARNASDFRGKLFKNYIKNLVLLVPLAAKQYVGCGFAAPGLLWLKTNLVADI